MPRSTVGYPSDSWASCYFSAHLDPRSEPVDAVDKNDEVAVRGKRVENAVEVGYDLVDAAMRVHDGDDVRGE